LLWLAAKAAPAADPIRLDGITPPPAADFYPPLNSYRSAPFIVHRTIFAMSPSKLRVATSEAEPLLTPRMTP
jgi:hypothetical protein